MSRGYGKSYSRKGSIQTSIQFDKLFNENSNRPSAVRSAGTVGKWGITSFTSIRTANGLGGYPPEEITPHKRVRLNSGDQNSKSCGSDPFSFDSSTTSAPAATPVAKPKKFFKSRNTEVKVAEEVYTKKPDYSFTYNKKIKQAKVTTPSSPLPPPPIQKVVPPKMSPRSSAPKKFFNSKNAAATSAEAKVTVPVPTLSPSKRDDNKPPIVLRISKGKSRLLSDSDESTECSPSPTIISVGLSSPSSKSESGSSKSPAHGRVTRSSRRHQQSSDHESDSNEQYSLFMSPRKSFESEPHYIPAEEYELERKAIYENLLGAGSPTYTTPSIPKPDNSTTNSDDQKQSPVSENKIDLSDENIKNSTSDEELITQPINLPDNPQEVDKSSSEVHNAVEPTEEIIPKIPTVQPEANTESDSDEVPNESATSSTLGHSSESKIDKMDEDNLDDEQPPIPPVKLVISKKKGSIFKSRSLVAGGSKKRHALYKHKWCDDKDPQKPKAETEKSSNSEAAVFDEMDFDSTELTRVTHWPSESADPMDEPEAITSIKCTKKAKGFYTVVRNVKKAHQIQEIGEFQEFNDDVDYILDALQDNNPNSTRCLSAITLATKCMAPAFRMHVRAHGKVSKFFRALHDASKDQSLGLCTATVMFVLSQDRLNIDIDRDCLELMLNLLESDVSHKNALNDCGLSSIQLEKNKQKVREICAEIQSQGHALHLNLDNITVGHLAMETLLSLTSKRAGEWFKEELRELGGLEHIIKTICECCRQVSDYVVTWTDALLDKLRKVDRCMRVLENVTILNEENTIYILQYDNGSVLDTLVKLFRLCDAEIPLYPVTDVTDKESTGVVIRETLFVTLKVFINLTYRYNSNSKGSQLIGSRPGVVDACLHLLLQVPNYIPEQKKFELSILVLMLLNSLVQHCDENKKLLLDAKAPAEFESIFPCDKSAIVALIEQFDARETLAHHAEQRTNAILDGEKDEASSAKPKSHEEAVEQTVDKLLQKAGTHMEHTMVAANIVLLLGNIIMDNPEYEKRVRSHIPSGDFKNMNEVLSKFLNFMNLTAAGDVVSVSHVKATEKVLKYLEKCDKPAVLAETSNNDVHISLPIETDRQTDTSSIDMDPFYLM